MVTDGPLEKVNKGRITIRIIEKCRSANGNRLFLAIFIAKTKEKNNDVSEIQVLVFCLFYNITNFFV